MKGEKGRNVEVCFFNFNVSIQNVKISGKNFQLVEKVTKLLTFPLIVLDYHKSRENVVRNKKFIVLLLLLFVCARIFVRYNM